MTSPAVAAWVRNDRLGLAIQYRKDGVSRRYFPDFITNKGDGNYFLIEIKGQSGDTMIKKAAAERWCRVVTNDGRLRRWNCALCFQIVDLNDALLDDRLTDNGRDSFATVRVGRDSYFRRRTELEQ